MNIVQYSVAGNHLNAILIYFLALIHSLHSRRRPDHIDLLNKIPDVSFDMIEG